MAFVPLALKSKEVTLRSVLRFAADRLESKAGQGTTLEREIREGTGDIGDGLN